MKVCGILKRGGGACGAPATVVVTFFQDGSGRVYACHTHIPKAVETVLAAANQVWSVKVSPLGSLKDRIVRAIRKNQRARER